MGLVGIRKAWMPGGPGLAVALLSASLLMAEILAMRQWKVALAYDVAFVVVPWTMMGLALGFLAAPFLSRLGVGTARLPAFLALGYAALSPVPFLALAALLRAPGQGIGLVADPLLSVPAALSAVAGSILWGAVVALLTSASPSPVRLYAWSLVGSTAGCVGSILVADALGASGAITAACLLALGGAMALVAASDLPRALLAGGAVAAVLAALALPGWTAVYSWDFEELTWTGSNASSQVDVIQVMGTELQEQIEESQIVGFPRTVKAFLAANDERRGAARFVSYAALEDVAWLRRDATFLAFLANRPRSVLVIGSGGGLEVAEALLAGCTSVTAVEINPLMVEATRALGSRVYDEPGVRVVVGEGRNFLRTTAERFDLVLMPNVKGYGGLGRSHGYLENYLLTREGLEEAVRVLNPGGILAVRDFDWGIDMVLAGLAASLPPDAAQPESRFLRVRAPRDILLYAPGGIAPGDRLRVISNLNPRWHPVALDSERLRRMALELDYGTDDHPYYHRLRAEDFLSGTEVSEAPTAGVAFGPLLHLALALGGAALVLAGAGCWLASRDRPGAGALPLAAWFALSGAGFVMVELVLMERLALDLGHPTMAVSVVLATLLAGSVVGSLGTERVPEAWLPRAAAGVAGLSALTVALLPGTLGALDGPLSFGTPAGRVATAVALLLPLGALLGVLFPLGLRRAVGISPSWIPWMWGMNAAAAVAAGPVGRIGAITFGFSEVLEAAAGVYLLAALVALFLQKAPRPAA